MSGPNDEPQQVRDDDADKSDHAAHRYRSACCRGHEDDQQSFEPLDRHADVKSFGLAERQQIETAADGRRQQQEQTQHRRDHGDLLPGRSGERTEHPEGDVAQLPVVGEKHQKPSAGAGERAERKAGQQHRRDRRPALPGGHAIEHCGSDKRAAEGRDRQQKQRAGQQERRRLIARDDSGRCRKAGAGRYADQARIGQRVTEQTLHYGTGTGQ